MFTFTTTTLDTDQPTQLQHAPVHHLLVCSTFDAGHLLAAGPAVELHLTGDRLLHLDKVGQEQDDLHFVVGQVSTTADALGSLDVWSTQNDHSGPLVDIFWGESGDIKQRQPI